MKRSTVILFRILMILYIIALAILCFGHFGNLPQIHSKILGLEQDKVFHFLMFLPFPLLSYFALGKSPSGPWKALGIVLLIFLAGCLIAAATEIGQGFLPYRTPDSKDFLADASAIALGSLTVFILMLVTGIRSSRTRS